GLLPAEQWISLLRTARADAHAMRARFGRRVTMPLEGELDLLGYEPIPDFAVLAGGSAPRAAVLRALVARLAAADEVVVYGPTDLRAFAGPRLTFRPLRTLEDDLREGRVSRLRVVGEVEDTLLRLAAERDVDLVLEPVLRASRAELRYGLRPR